MSDYLIHIVVFLQTIRSYAPLPSTHVDAISDLYGVSTLPNVEVRLQFYLVALADPESDVAKRFTPIALKWIVGEDGATFKGRMKFCRPIFVSASKVDYDLAVKKFKAYQAAFHPIARKLIEKVRLRCVIRAL
jgi:leukotriene-A4 hydrolase